MKEISWVADIGSNHNQNLDWALRLIEIASDIGCNGVKFQYYRGQELYADDKRASEANKSCTPPKWLPDLREKAKEVGVNFGITPFSLDGVDICKDHIDFFKIASFSTSFTPLINKCVRSGKPTVISVGMMSNEEIFDLASALEKVALNDVFFLWCCPEYPAKLENCALHNISLLDEKFGGGIGWSDHTRDPYAIHRAIQNGATTIEFHLDTEDMDGMESVHGHCWSPSSIKGIISGYERSERSMSGNIGEIVEMRKLNYKDLIANPLTGRRGE